MLKDTDGFELCKKITFDYKIPILMVTARNDIIERILGLELGADYYITKPFEIREVISRVKVAFSLGRAILRKLGASKVCPLRFQTL